MNKDQRALIPLNLLMTMCVLGTKLICKIEKNELDFLDQFKYSVKAEKKLKRSIKELSESGFTDWRLDKILTKAHIIVDSLEVTGRKKFKWSDVTVNWIKEMEG